MSVTKHDVMNVVDDVFQLLDADGDGTLEYTEFIVVFELIDLLLAMKHNEQIRIAVELEASISLLHQHRAYGDIQETIAARTRTSTNETAAGWLSKLEHQERKVTKMSAGPKKIEAERDLLALNSEAADNMDKKQLMNLKKTIDEWRAKYEHVEAGPDVV